MTKSFFYTNAGNIQSIIHESGFTLKYVKTTLSINVCGGENWNKIIKKENTYWLPFIRQTYNKFS